MIHVVYNILEKHKNATVAAYLASVTQWIN